MQNPAHSLQVIVGIHSDPAVVVRFEKMQIKKESCQGIAFRHADKAANLENALQRPKVVVMVVRVSAAASALPFRS